MVTAADVRGRLADLADPEDAVFLQRYFKTGPGEYAEGDRFLGIRVPVLRKLAREYRDLPLAAVTELLRSELHEERLLALLLLVRAYERGSPAQRDEIYRIYLDHTRFINNWDLVDSSAEHIVGAHLDPLDTRVLERLARSELLWERRIAVLATFHYIKRGEYRPTLHIAGMLLDDAHDLIHKAVGWMLREIGEREPAVAETFLREHYRSMPRTMLRYAIERFPGALRQQYLKGQV